MALQDDLYLATGNSLNQLGINTGAVVTGIGPAGRVLVYDIVPLTLQANNVAASQSPGTGAITLTAGTGTTSVTASNGLAAVQLDVPRILRYTSGGTDTGITFTASGFDVYGQAMTETVTGAAATVASGKKAFYQITGITHTGSVFSTLTVGTGDVFGLPYFAANAVYIQGVQWNSTLAKDTGTFTAGVTTSPATSLTGDVRGTYAPSTGASDGVKRLVMLQAISAAQVGTAATRVSVLGVTQA
jgi:hypothetical protein